MYNAPEREVNVADCMDDDSNCTSRKKGKFKYRPLPTSENDEIDERQVCSFTFKGKIKYFKASKFNVGVGLNFFGFISFFLVFALSTQMRCEQNTGVVVAKHLSNLFLVLTVF